MMYYEIRHRAELKYKYERWVYIELYSNGRCNMKIGEPLELDETNPPINHISDFYDNLDGVVI